MIDELPQANSASRRARSATRRSSQRCVYALVNEGARILEEGIAQRASRHRHGVPHRLRLPAAPRRPDALRRPGRPVQRRAGDEALRRRIRATTRRSGSRRRCWRSWPPKARPSTERPSRTNRPGATTMTRRRHRLHRPHRPRQELEGRLQHDPRRDPGRPRRSSTRSSAPASIRREVEDVIMGCADARRRHRRQHRARRSRCAPACRSPSAGVTVNRFCSSGLQTIAMAAQRIIAGEGESSWPAAWRSSPACRRRSTRHMLRRPVAARAQARDLLVDAADRRDRSPSATTSRASAWTSTARASQQRAAAAAGRRQVRRRDRADHRDGRGRHGDRACARKEVTISRRRGHPRRTRPWKASSKIRPALPGGVITAGNASQFSDGARRCVVMNAKLRRAARPQAAGHLPRLRRRRLRARRDGHRPGVRGAQAAEARRPEGRRHRPVGTERGVRGAGDLLPRQARHPRRPPERQRRRHRGRPSLRRERASA